MKATVVPLTVNTIPLSGCGQSCWPFVGGESADHVEAELRYGRP